MKLRNNTLASILFSTIETLIFILFLPIIIIFYPFYYVQKRQFDFRRKQFEQKYSAFLIEMSGKNFFCYNNREHAKNYIENKIIPHLNDGIEIVYLNGKIVQSEYDAELISSTLYKLRNYSGFPHLIKIRNGKLIDKSINNPFYNVLNLKKSTDELLNRIHCFFAE